MISENEIMRKKSDLDGLVQQEFFPNQSILTRT